MADANLLDKINQYFAGFNNPAPSGGTLYNVGSGIRPGVLRETLGPILGVQKTPYQDLGLLQRIIGLPAQMGKTLVGATQKAGEFYGMPRPDQLPQVSDILGQLMAGATAQVQQPGAPPTQAGGETTRMQVTPQPVTNPAQPAAPQAAQPQGVGQEELMKRWFKAQAHIESLDIGDGAKRNLRAQAANGLIDQGFSQEEAPALMLWVNEGSAAGKDMLEASTRLQAAGMRGVGGKSRTNAEIMQANSLKEYEQSVNDLMLKMTTDKDWKKMADKGWIRTDLDPAAFRTFAKAIIGPPPTITNPLTPPEVPQGVFKGPKEAKAAGHKSGETVKLMKADGTVVSYKLP